MNNENKAYVSTNGEVMRSWERSVLFYKEKPAESEWSAETIIQRSFTSF